MNLDTTALSALFPPVSSLPLHNRICVVISYHYGKHSCSSSSNRFTCRNTCDQYRHGQAFDSVRRSSRVRCVHHRCTAVQLLFSKAYVQCVYVDLPHKWQLRRYVLWSNTRSSLLAKLLPERAWRD